MFIVKTESIVKAPVKIEYKALDFWGSLDQADQHTLERETASFFVARQMEGISQYEQAKHLKAIKEVLKEKRMFVGFCKRGLKMQYRKAQRYVRAFEKLCFDMPNHEQVAKVAAAQGMNLLGYTELRPYGAYSKIIPAMLPAPTTEKELVPWVQEAEAKRKALPYGGRRGKKATVAPEDRLTEAYRAAAKQLREIRGSKKATAEKLIAYIMFEAGLSTQKFSPEPVPAEVQPQGPGRKRKAAAA